MERKTADRVRSHVCVPVCTENARGVAVPASAAGKTAGVKSRGPGQTGVGLSLGTIMTSCSVTLTSHFTSLKSGVVAVQSRSHVQLFGTPWTAARQASLPAISQSLLKLMSIELVMLSISSSIIPLSSCLQSFPASGFLLISLFFASGGQSIGASTSASVLLMIIHD